jgi:hypothetical protein
MCIGAEPERAEVGDSGCAGTHWRRTSSSGADELKRSKEGGSGGGGHDGRRRLVRISGRRREAAEAAGTTGDEGDRLCDELTKMIITKMKITD